MNKNLQLIAALPLAWSLSTNAFAGDVNETANAGFKKNVPVKEELSLPSVKQWKGEKKLSDVLNKNSQNTSKETPMSISFKFDKGTGWAEVNKDRTLSALIESEIPENNGNGRLDGQELKKVQWAMNGCPINGGYTTTFNFTQKGISTSKLNTDPNWMRNNCENPFAKAGNVAGTDVKDSVKDPKGSINNPIIITPENQESKTGAYTAVAGSGNRDNVFMIDYNFDGQLDTLTVEGDETRVVYGGLEKTVKHDNDMIRGLFLKSIDIKDKREYDENGLLLSEQAPEVIKYFVATNDNSEGTKIADANGFSLVTDLLASHNVKFSYELDKFVDQSKGKYEVFENEQGAKVYMDSFGTEVSALEIGFKMIFGSGLYAAFSSDFRPDRKINKALENARGAELNQSTMYINQGGKDNLQNTTLTSYNNHAKMYMDQIAATQLNSEDLNKF